MGSKKGLCPEFILSDISASHLAHLSQGGLGALLIFKGTTSPKPDFPEGHFP